MTFLFVILKTINFLFTLAICLWSWKKLGNKRVRLLFCFMLAFFFLSTVLFGADSLSDTWLKHILFYIGQFFFYLFVVALIAGYDKSSNDAFDVSTAKNPFTGDGRGALAVAGMTSMTDSGVGDWIDFITDQGIQHMLTLPLLLLIITTVEIRYVFVTSKAFRSVLNTFMFAAAALMTIHLMEFIVESQKLIPFLDGDLNEVLEFIWYYFGLFFFVRGIFLLKNISTVQIPNPQTVHSPL